MKKTIILFLLIAKTIYAQAQEDKIYQYSDYEVVIKPSSTKEFEEWIYKNNAKIGKPAPASTKKTTKVTLTFCVDTTGKIHKVFIWRGIGQGYDEYASKLIRNNPFNWTPGKNANLEAVETVVYYQLDYIKNKNFIVDKAIKAIRKAK